jgi:uncharacterized protein YhfF
VSDPLPVIEFAFSGSLRDSLIAAIRSGAKTSTSSLLREYEIEGEPLPSIGDRGDVIDSNGERVLTVETVAVDVVRLSDVPLEHALAEGEGYSTVAEWREGHVRYWESADLRAHLGIDVVVDDDTLVVLERFVVVR